MAVFNYKHKQRGTKYSIINEGKMSMSSPTFDGEEVVVYLGEDGQIWVRPKEEFFDGRFEEIE